MLAFFAIIGGLVLGLLAGGRLSNLTKTAVRGEAYILVLFVIQSLARGPLLEALNRYSIIVWGLCAVGLLGLLLVQLRLPGVVPLAVGLCLNALVILLNRGMPVTPPTPSAAASVASAVAEHAGFYRLADSRTYAVALGDVLPLGSNLASVGDVALAVGVCVLIAYSMQSESV